MVKTQLGDDGRSLEVARRGAVAADRWLNEAFGHPLQEQTAIRLARTANCVWIDGFGDQSTAWSGSGGVCVYTSRPRWRSMRERDGGRDAVELIAHEAIHEAQRELGCVDEPDQQRFRWLMEGTAVYGAREALIATGERRAEETEASIREAAASGAISWRSSCSRPATETTPPTSSGTARSGCSRTSTGDRRALADVLRARSAKRQALAQRVRGQLRSHHGRVLRRIRPPARM